MWQKFNQASRQAVLLGLEEATSLNSPQVDSEHLLLGLLREEGGIASRMFERMGVSYERVRQEVEKAATGSHIVDKPQLSPEAKRILELSARAAGNRSHTTIGAEHLLLVLLSEPNNEASKLLQRLGLDLEPIRTKVAESVGPEQPLPSEESHSESNILVQKYLGAELKEGREIPTHLKELALRWTKANVEKEIAVHSNHYELAAEFRQQAEEIESLFAQQVEEWRQSSP